MFSYLTCIFIYSFSKLKASLLCIYYNICWYLFGVKDIYC